MTLFWEHIWSFIVSADTTEMACKFFRDIGWAEGYWYGRSYTYARLSLVRPLCTAMRNL